MNLSQLRYFAAVAQFEHYGKAANALFITQPALSNAIRRLEKELGFTLFENVGRNVTLTQSGKRLYKSVSKALAELDHGIAEARQEDEANKPAVRVGSVAALLRGPLSNMLNDFNKSAKSPLIFSISQQDSTREALFNMRSNLLDCAFCGNPVNEIGISWVPLVEQYIVAVVDQSHPLASLSTVSFDELSNYEMYSYRPPSYMYYALKGLFDHKGLHVQPAFENEISSLSVAAINKGAVCITLDTTRDVIWDSLRMIPIKEALTPYHQVGFAWKTVDGDSKRLKPFIDFIVNASNAIDFNEPLEIGYQFI